MSGRRRTGPRGTPPPDFLVVAVLSSPFGLRGEIRARIVTDFPERLLELKEVFLGPHLRPFRVRSVRFHRGEVLFQLEGVSSREEAALLRGLEVQVPIHEAPALPEDAYFYFELLGLEVVTEEGEVLGELVEILETGANDVYIVRSPEGREVLLPAIREVIREVNVPEGRMVVRLLPGLLD